MNCRKIITLIHFEYKFYIKFDGYNHRTKVKIQKLTISANNIWTVTESLKRWGKQQKVNKK